MFHLTTHSTHFMYSNMASDKPEIVRGNLQQGFFYTHYLTDRITHTTAFVISVVDHEKYINGFTINLKDRSDDPSHHEQTQLHLAPVFRDVVRFILSLQRRGNIFPIRNIRTAV